MLLQGQWNHPKFDLLQSISHFYQTIAMLLFATITVIYDAFKKTDARAAHIQSVLVSLHK